MLLNIGLLGSFTRVLRLAKFIDQDTGKEFPLYPTEEWKADQEQFASEACAHEVVESRRAKYANGSLHVIRQCQRCGANLGTIPKNQAPQGVADADPTMRQRYEVERECQRQEINQKHVRIQRNNGNLFRLRHQEYLSTTAWKTRRDKVLQRADSICEGCMDAKATVVHHLSYDHWGDELLYELVALCVSCHDRCHPEIALEQFKREPPCYGCRCIDWDGASMRCEKFNEPTLKALSIGGKCGPRATALEPLR